jgi:hypothetical protein
MFRSAADLLAPCEHSFDVLRNAPVGGRSALVEFTDQRSVGGVIVDNTPRDAHQLLHEYNRPRIVDLIDGWAQGKAPEKNPRTLRGWLRGYGPEPVPLWPEGPLGCVAGGSSD